MSNTGSGSPRSFNDLPQDVRAACADLLDGLQAVVGNNLYGIYIYGAVVFTEMKHIHDIDCHVILKSPLTVRQNEGVRQLHNKIVNEHHIGRDDLDAWYILQDDARQTSPPRHQVYPDLFDNSWALHYAHMRAGYCIVLYGPEPEQVFYEPTWLELLAGLEAERIFIETNLSQYPDYCVLNLCRLIYSYRTRDVVVSKQTSAEWVLDNFTVWRPLIEAALRSYAGDINEQDKRLLESETGRFYKYACEMIKEIDRE
jgi:hypothetical protein